MTLVLCMTSLGWGRVLDVWVLDGSYEPAEVTIEVGDQLRWFFVGPDAHSATAIAGQSDWWDTGIQSPGIYSLNLFTVEGTFEYYCQVHGEDHGDGTATGHIGSVHVTAPSGDTDGDGLSDLHEVWFGADPTLPDTDGDGLLDGEEVDEDLDPTIADTDGDGLLDGDELERGTSPAAVDTDGDGLTDGDEVLFLDTDPLDEDTDGGGITDGDEVERGTDPCELADDFATGIQLLVPTDAEAGLRSTFYIDNATPSTMVYLVATTTEGLTTVPGCPDLEIALDAPFVAARGEAGPTGRLNLNLLFPDDMSGDNVLFSAIQTDSCRTSDVELVMMP